MPSPEILFKTHEEFSRFYTRIMNIHYDFLYGDNLAKFLRDTETWQTEVRQGTYLLTDLTQTIRLFETNNWFWEQYKDTTIPPRKVAREFYGHEEAHLVVCREFGMTKPVIRLVTTRDRSFYAYIDFPDINELSRVSGGDAKKLKYILGRILLAPSRANQFPDEFESKLAIDYLDASGMWDRKS